MNQAMSVTAWSFPTRILFGVGAVRELGPLAKGLGKKALIVTDAGVVGTGAIDKVRAALDAAGVAHATWDGVEGNPHEPNVFEGLAAYRAAGADLIVAVGGGSPLDVAKLVRLMATHEPPLAQYDDAIGGDAKIVRDVPPMLAVPTTAGTGSEVGRSGVVTLTATNQKTVIFGPRLLANAAILDPELTVSMPARITAATGIDALTHNLEAYLALGDHPLADSIALGGLELCARSLVRATHHGADLTARGDMMKAAAMGAIAFQKGLGACHSLAHPLGADKGLHHGLANALCLSAVVAWNPRGRHRARRARGPRVRRRGQRARRQAARPQRRARLARGSTRRGRRRRRPREPRRPRLRGRLPPQQPAPMHARRPARALPRVDGMSERAVSVDEEAEHLLDLYAGNGPAIMDAIQRQMSILAGRAQMLLQLAGLTITVTGFSGASIAHSGRLGAILIVSGLVLVLIAASITMVGILRVQWTTSLAPMPLPEAVRRALRLRDEKTTAYGRALSVLVVGLALYVSSVAVLLLGNLPAH